MKQRIVSNKLSTGYVYDSPLPNTPGWFIASVLYGEKRGPEEISFELIHFTAQSAETAIEAAMNWVHKKFDPTAELHPV